MFIRELLQDLGVTPTHPTALRTDSKSAVDLAFDPIAFKNTKHILRAAEFLRDLVMRLVVVVEHVAGSTMIADLLTKPCARATFVKLRELLDNFSTSGDVVITPFKTSANVPS